MPIILLSRQLSFSYTCEGFLKKLKDKGHRKILSNFLSQYQEYQEKFESEIAESETAESEIAESEIVVQRQSSGQFQPSQILPAWEQSYQSEENYRKAFVAHQKSSLKGKSCKVLKKIEENQKKY